MEYDWGVSKNEIGKNLIEDTIGISLFPNWCLDRFYCDWDILGNLGFDFQYHESKSWAYPMILSIM